MNVHLEAPLLMHYSAAFIGCLCSQFGALHCLHLETNVGLLRDRRMVFALDLNPHAPMHILAPSIARVQEENKIYYKSIA